MRKLASIRRSTRGLSPIISVLLLIAIAIVASLVVYAWVMGYIGGSTTKSGDAIQIQSFTATNGFLTVYVQNTGQGVVDLSPANSVYVNTALEAITQSPIGTTTPNPVPIGLGKTVSIVTNYPYSVFDSITLKIVTTQGVSTSITGKASAASTDNPTGVTITPTSANIAAGGSQTYQAIAIDKNGNSLGVVQATFSVGTTQITGSTVTETKTGVYSVTAVYKGMTSNAASLNVGPATAQTVTISPATASIAAGATETYSATAVDQYGNSLGSITSSAVFYVNGGKFSSNSNSLMETATGTYTVTATYEGVTSNSASLTVGAGSTITVTISPSTPTIVAGGSQAFTASAKDQYGNNLGDVTSQSTFSVNNSPITGSTVQENLMGTYQVTATYSSAISNTAQLTVTPAAPVSLALTPTSNSVTSGNTQTYVVTATDTYTNQWVATSQVTTWSINSAAGGSWSGATYTSQYAGTWAVTASIGTVTSNSAQLTVTAGGLDHFTVMSPGPVQIGTETAGQAFQIVVTAVDKNGNPYTTYTGTNTLQLWSTAGTQGTITPVSTAAFTGGTWTGSVTCSAVNPGYILTSGGGKSGQSNNFIVNSAPTGDNILIFTAGTTQSLQDGVKSTVITVERETSSGTPITSGTTSITLSAQPSTGAEFLSSTGGTITTISITGTASTASFYFEDTALGPVQLTATSGSTYNNLPFTPVSTTFTITVGPCTQLAISDTSGNSITGNDYTAGTPFTIQVETQDQYDNVVSWTGTVTLSDLSPSGSLTPTSVSLTNGVGTASITITKAYQELLGKEDTLTASATVSGNAVKGTASFYVEAAAASQVVITGPTSIAHGTTRTAYTVQIEDKYGNAIFEIFETVTLKTSSSTGGFYTAATGGTKVTSLTYFLASSGTIYYVDTSNANSPDTLTASVTGLTSGTLSVTIT